MMPIPQRGGSIAPWRFRSRGNDSARGARAGARADCGRLGGQRDLAGARRTIAELTTRLAVVGAPGTTPRMRLLPGIAGDVEVAPNGDLILPTLVAV